MIISYISIFIRYWFTKIESKYCRNDLGISLYLFSYFRIFFISFNNLYTTFSTENFLNFSNHCKIGYREIQFPAVNCCVSLIR